ncbi:MAG: 23S rRNA (guanosine(2251)-2'-O)-methyltransferase RlmB [Rickettsiales bacterium]|jgi:23S rRNA (guanosine2251-2'-O)-methyltransferase|nr:23S rRNA (guanosine(2251)-2'-O)-methyltransferase RlmB [Rickettsiales bacterium]
MNTIIYGKHPVFLALKNRTKSFISIYTSNIAVLLEYLSKNQIDIDPSIISCKNNVELGKILKNGANHQGYLAYVRENRKITLDDFRDSVKITTRDLPRLVLLNDLTDPHNVGAIIRTAAAFGVDYIIKTKHNSPKDLSTIAKTSAGTSELINIIEIVNINRTIEILKDMGYFVVGLSEKSNYVLSKAENMDKACLVVGNEEKGLKQLVRKNCDRLCCIKMQCTGVESLNASVAVAIAIYELWG